MIKRILVPLDPSMYSNTATEYACQIARAHGAEVTGFTILDTPGISTGPMSPGAMAFAIKAEKRREAEAHEQIQSMLGQFRSRVEEAEVGHREVEVSGDPKTEIIAASFFYDLVIMGLRTFYHFETSSEPDNTLSDIVGKMVAPILAVPDTFRPFHKKLNVIMAYNGSVAAARSIREFTQLALFANPNVTLLSSNEEMDDAHAIMQPAEDYLRAYGYTDVKQEWTPLGIIDATRDLYLEEAELMVLGMHTKRGLFDFRAGSFARFLMDQTTVPVFLGQ